MFSLSLTRARTRLTVASLAAVLSQGRLPGAAAAEPSPTFASASLELDSNPNCATSTALIARVRARSPRVRFVDDGTGLKIRAQIAELQSGAVRSEVTFASGVGKASVRHVIARNCSLATDAVALIIAVTLDPTSAAQPEPNATGSETTSPSPSEAESTTAGKSSTGPRSVSPTARAAHGDEASLEPIEAPRPGTLARAWKGTVGVQLAAEAMAGPGPGFMPAIALETIVGFDRPRLWSPALGVGVHHAFRSVREAGGRASFTLDAATLDACPIRLAWGVFDARPCASVLLGLLSAYGDDTTNPAPKSSRPFWVLGASLVVSADLVRHLSLSGRLSAGANLVRDSYEFRPATFYSVPFITSTASLGVGVRW